MSNLRNNLFHKINYTYPKKKKSEIHTYNKETRFISTQNIVSACSILLSPGIWSINFIFELSNDSVNGDGIHNNITYGISMNPHSFDLVKINDIYNIFHDDITTHQTYHRTFIHEFKEHTVIYLDAFLNNPKEEVSVFMKNSCLDAINLK